MTSMYGEGLKLPDEKFDNGKDNLTSLTMIIRGSGANGKPRPAVRCVDTYYEDYTFHTITYGRSSKMLQIEQNTKVAVTPSSGIFTVMGIGESPGWTFDPQSAKIRTKLCIAFANWYDMANNEKNENCCTLAIHLIRGTLDTNHWEKLYHLDFVDKTDREDGGTT